MIVAHLFGGPKDGDVLTLAQLEPTLLCPVFPLDVNNATLPVAGEFEGLISVGAYLPDHGTYYDCPCHPLCPHGTIKYRWRESA